MALRKPTAGERALLGHLSTQAMGRPDAPPILWDGLLVEPQGSGGSGASLRIVPRGRNKVERTFGERVGSIDFLDRDNVPVTCHLVTDHEGFLYELEFWKPNFTRVQFIPESY